MAILCYHTVDPSWTSGLAMAPATFATHAAWLARHRRVVDLATAVRLMDRRGRLPRGVVALTFDDGLDGLYDHALPVLRTLGLPATVFVVARTLTGDTTVDWIDDPPPHALGTLSVDQLREMVDAGLEVASHSLAHHVLPHLSEWECRQDLVSSRELLEDAFGRPVRTLAYPRGRHAPHVRRAARLAGHSHAFALPEGPEPIGPFALPRVGVYRHNGLATIRVKSGPRYLALRTTAFYPAAVARAVRSAATRGHDPAIDRPTPAAAPAVRSPSEGSS